MRVQARERMHASGARGRLPFRVRGTIDRPLLRPSAIAVHDEGDVIWNRPAAQDFRDHVPRRPVHQPPRPWRFPGRWL